MLKIVEIRPCEFPVSVEIDFYIPLAVRTYTPPIGAVFYRVGNFNTSLVELPIDPDSGMLRGIKVVCLDCIGAGICDDNLPAEQGLPVVARESMPMRIFDETRGVAVNLIGSRFFIDWSNGERIEAKATVGRLTFFLGRGTLLGAAIEKITDSEALQLRAHLQKVRKE